MKGVSSLLSLVLYTAIMVVGIGLVVNVALPTLENMQDSSAIQNSIDVLTGMDSVINEVAAGTEGTARTVTLTFKRGSYRFDNATGELYYQIDTRSSIVSSHAVQERGPLKISADADISVTQTDVNGTTCYMMQNDHLNACIRKVSETFNASDHQNLVGFWQFDEGSGQWANDSSLYGNNGKLGGSTATESSDPTWAAGIHDDGLLFDGEDDDVVVPSLEYTDTGTVAAWYRLNATSSSRKYIYSNAGADSLSRVYLFARGGTMEVSVGGNDAIDTGYSVPTDRWEHAALTWDGGSYTLYVDGEQVDTGSYSDTVSDTLDTYIGSQNGGQQFWNGSIDEVRLYNRSLTGEEVEWLFLKQGDAEYVNTSHMLVQLYNKDLGEELNASLATFVNGNRSLRAGTGFTTAETGESLGRGRVVLNVTSGDTSYRLAYDLITGADFLTLRTAGSAAENTTHGLDMVLDARDTDEKYIDNQQRGEGLYTRSGVNFGYGVGEASGRVAGLVPGGTFDTVGYGADTGEGRYGFNLTTSRDAVFLPFTEGDHGVIQDRKGLIQGKIFGPGNFLGFPRPNFAYGLSQDKTVKVSISFDNVVLNGFDDPIHQGSYELIVENTGVQDGKAVVNITRQ